MLKKRQPHLPNKDTKHKGSVSKHKYEVHYHEWQKEELDNLLETISNAPTDLGHKAKWRWIAKAMTTERVFTYHDCHHAFKYASKSPGRVEKERKGKNGEDTGGKRRS